jgi:TonB family protein
MDKKAIDLGRQALQVLVCFDGAVLAAHQLIAGQTLAVGAETDYPVCAPGMARWDIAGIDVAGPYVQFPESAEGEVRLGRTRRPLAELVRGGWCAAHDGLYRHALVDGEQATVTFGPLTVLVRREEASYRVPRPRYADRDWSAHRWTAVVAGGVALLLLLAFSVPPEPALASSSMRLDQAALRRLTLRPQVEPPRPKAEAMNAPPGGGAPRSKVRPGGGGSHRPRPLSPAVARGGAPSAKPLDKSAVAKLAGEHGVLAILGAAKGGSMLGTLLDSSTSSLGDGAESVFAGLSGSERADNWGPGPGTITGHGPGPGGTCTGPNCLDTIGVGTSPCPGGHCGGLPGGRPAHGPVLAARASRPVIDVAPAGLIVSKEIDKEVIRRVIRTRMNEIRFCYEKGLMQEPHLEGKLVVSFLIQHDGRVTAVTPRESSIANAAVERCVVEAVARLSFPVPPDARLAQVTYPFVFRHAAGAP